MNEIGKCDYCEEEAKYCQYFEIQKIGEKKRTVEWVRSACEIHKDHSED